MNEKDVIEDSRTDFKTLTFSNYKRSQVKNELLNSILSGKVENSCYWCAELVCSGCLQDIWNIIICMVSVYINVSNPKMPTYVEKRYKYFRSLMQAEIGNANQELLARNNFKIRELFTEMMCVIAASKRRTKMSMVQLDVKTAFDMHSVSDHLAAPSIKYGHDVFKPIDPKELFIPVNEMAYHISNESRNCTSSCYWIEWILQFEYRITKKNELCKCAMRTIPPEIADRHGNDVGWLIWEVLQQEVRRRNAALLTAIVDSLYFLYCFRYKSSTARKRRPILYHVCYLLTEPIDIEQRIIENERSLQNVISRTNLVYRQIKKHEVKDKMDYLKTII